MADHHGSACPCVGSYALRWRRRRARARRARGARARGARARRARARRTRVQWTRARRARRARARGWLTWLRGRRIDRWLSPPDRAAIVGERLRLLLDQHAVAIAAEPERGRRHEAQERGRATTDREARTEVVTRELARGEAERAADDPGRHRRMLDGEAAPRRRGQRGHQRDGGPRPCPRAHVPDPPRDLGARPLAACRASSSTLRVYFVVGRRHAVAYHGRPGTPEPAPGRWHSAPPCASQGATFAFSTNSYISVILMFLG
jgi:hypothetical protein